MGVSWGSREEVRSLGVIGPAPKDLLSDVQSSFGRVKTNSDGILLTVLATLGCGAGTTEGMWELIL